MSPPAFFVAARPRKICVPKEASPVSIFAGEQMAYYLQVITGQRFQVGPGAGDIRLSLAQTATLPPGSFQVVVTPEAAELVGYDELSLLHAVYWFLDAKCGCRWLSAFEGGEIIPRNPDLAVEVGAETRRPVFAHRAFTNYPNIDARTVEMVDWMCKSGFNRFMVFLNVEGAFERYREVLKPELALRGMRVEMGHHSFRYWLPPAVHFKAHPEWYSELGGVRRADGQLCTTNPEVAEAVAQRICDFLAANPEVDMVGLWPNDGYGWCECSGCTAVEPQRPAGLFPAQPARTETYLRFVSRVAELVAQQHPGKRLSALAYVNYVEPPEFELPPNVAVCFAPFQHCFKHPLNAPAECVRNNARYAKLLVEWRKRVSDELYLFCYYMLIDMCSLPYGVTRVLKPSFQWLAEHGCDGYVMEFRPEEWGPFGVNAHLIGRLSWNPELDVDTWLSDYYNSLYGPAAEDMRQYWETYLDRFIEPGPCVYHYDLTYTRRATHELLRPALEHLGRARARAVTGERRHVEAVERAHMSIELVLRMGEWQRVLAEARQAQGPKGQVLADRAQRLGQELVAWAQAHGDTGAVFAPGIETAVAAHSPTQMEVQ